MLVRSAYFGEINFHPFWLPPALDSLKESVAIASHNHPLPRVWSLGPGTSNQQFELIYRDGLTLGPAVTPPPSDHS